MHLSQEDIQRIVEENERTSRTWCCPDCGAEHDIGRGIAPGTEDCLACGPLAVTAEEAAHWAAFEPSDASPAVTGSP